MRRAIEIISVLFILAGLELAAGTLSHTLGRLEETIRLTSAGDSFALPPAAFVAGITLFALGVLFALMTVWARSAANAVQATPDCPRCGSETKRMKRRMRHRILAALIGHRVTHRYCGRCSWGGLSLKQ